MGIVLGTLVVTTVVVTAVGAYAVVKWRNGKNQGLRVEVQVAAEADEGGGNFGPHDLPGGGDGGLLENEDEMLDAVPVVVAAPDAALLQPQPPNEDEMPDAVPVAVVAPDAAMLPAQPPNEDEIPDAVPGDVVAPHAAVHQPQPPHVAITFRDLLTASLEEAIEIVRALVDSAEDFHGPAHHEEGVLWYTDEDGISVCSSCGERHITNAMRHAEADQFGERAGLKTVHFSQCEQCDFDWTASQLIMRIRLRGRNTPDRVLSRDVVRELLEEVNPRILRCPWPQCGALCDKRYRDPNAMAGAIDDDDGADHGAANGGAPAAHL